ncbi:TPA: hypothetical protein QIX74_001524 [Staphylococcus aureus]|nr:hypothetical protein [Staphylococcus aureus]HDG4682643.1 hypothetical protein [Staphylococcus aureus]HEO8862667.1 hypothetical protein [Staphylococcus aureus]
MLSKKTQYVLMVVCSIVLIVCVVAGVQQSKKADLLARQIRNTVVPEKEVKQTTIHPDTVKEYEKLLEDKIDEFLRDDYKDDDIFVEDTAGNTFYALFTPIGIKGIDKNSTHKDKLEYFKHFTYDLSNVSAQTAPEDGETQINANIEVKIDGKKVDNGYNLFTVKLGSDGKLKEGTLYVEQ